MFTPNPKLKPKSRAELPATAPAHRSGSASASGSTPAPRSGSGEGIQTGLDRPDTKLSSRKSSIASHLNSTTTTTAHRAPASLRLPSIRKTSNAQLSKIFAMGDSASPSGSTSGTSRYTDSGKNGAGSGVSGVEQVLSRQLDGDLGGRQMGLRSRRSSSATIRTVRTTSGLGSPGAGPGPDSDTMSVMEVNEDKMHVGKQGREETDGRRRINDSPEPIAGPSSRPLSSDTPQNQLSGSTNTSRNPSPGPGRSPTKQKLNPKTSSSWLRWTSPAPSFPRSTSAGRASLNSNGNGNGNGKGKGREILSDNQGINGGRPDLAIGEPQSTLDLTSDRTAAQTEEPLSLPSNYPDVDPDLDLGLASNTTSSDRKDSSLLRPPEFSQVEPMSTDSELLPTDQSKQNRKQSEVSIPPPSPARGRGWFGRSTPMPTPKPASISSPSTQVPQSSEPSVPLQTAEGSLSSDHSSLLPANDRARAAVSSSNPSLSKEREQSEAQGVPSSPTAVPPTLDPGATTTSTQPATISPALRQVESSSRSGSQATSTVAVDAENENHIRETQRGWKGYLGWGGAGSADKTIDTPSPHTQANEQLATGSSTLEQKSPGLGSEQLGPQQFLTGKEERKSVAAATSPGEHPTQTEASSRPQADTSAHFQPLPPAQTETQTQTRTPIQPWSSYLYSFVVPEIRPRPSVSSADPSGPTGISASTHSNFVEPTAPTEDQKPVHLEPPSAEKTPATTTKPAAGPSSAPTAVPAQQSSTDPSAHSQSTSPTRDTPENANPNPSTASDRRPSSSTAGWLNYLAFRASQKKITSSSIQTSDDGGLKSEQHASAAVPAGEEVMDFSSDPDFPTANAVVIRESQGSTPASLHATMGSAITRGAKDVKMAAESIKSVTPKPSQNLDVKKKRLSTSSSIISNATGNGSLTPVSGSPRARSSLESNRGVVPSGSSSSVHKSVSGVAAGAAPSTGNVANSGVAPGSALPALPSAPSIQPNLVIPTFATTFDRPPRSFLSLPPPLPSPNVAEPHSPTSPGPNSGITAATTGLAWRALGAVGTYVYGAGGSGAGGVGGSGDQSKVGPETILEDEAEQRGRKEGRSVGPDLPRRIGLGTGAPDDGWKNVKRVVVVGVHGWFPAKMLNSVIGEPTGTSVKFANMMGQAVKQFFVEKGVNVDEDLRLTLMPLEGEGTIESRVDRLYKAYLSNPAWINDLRRADAVFFAAHSQGCIVTTHLISRLIAQGHVRTRLNAEAVARCEWAFGPIGVVPDEPRRVRGRGLAALRGTSFHSVVQGSEGGYQKVAMLAMCGVHLGPLYSISTSTVIQPYLQWFENAAARELFEFQDTASAVSQAYQKALSMVLENEVRVVLLASLNDQVVPIYGSSFSVASHPLLLRALYVDGASYTQSDFMTNLLCFAFMLRNAGIDDQRLVEHLSEATAGSLTGVGHSTPYEELSSYSLAVQYLFHAGPIPSGYPIPPLEVEPFSAREPKNDFELPWIMRALVDSPQVKDLFPGELRDLKESILNWRPTTKALREIKRRLEPMAGRQSRLRAIHTSPSSSSLASASEQAQAGAMLGASPGANKALGSGLRRDW